MKKPIIKEYDKPFDLSEVYQKSGLRYAFISAPKAGSAMCHPFVKCRDFLHDAVRAMVTKSSCQIYGFKYDSQVDPPIDLARIRMRLKYDNKSKKDFATVVEGGLKLINYYEAAMGGKIRSKAVLCADGKYIVSGPSAWLRTPVLTTLYTLLFRIAEHSPNWDLAEKDNLEKMYKELLIRFKDKLNKAEFKDLEYLKQTYKQLQVVVENYHSLCEMYTGKYDPVVTNGKFTINKYHNSGGIVSLCTGSYMMKGRLDILKTLIEEQKEGKALLRVKGYGDLGPYVSYQPNKLSFAFVHSEEDVRTQCTDFTDCREQVVSMFRNRHVDNNHQDGWLLEQQNKITAPHVDDEKLRLLVRVPGVLRDRVRMAQHKKELFFAKRVINYYEKYLGMKKSVISTVLIKYKNGVQYGWLFTANSEWLDSPVLLSLYVTLLRSAKSYMYNHIRLPKAYPLPENINGKAVKKLWATMHETGGFAKKHDKDIHTHSTMVHKVLKNRKTLFSAGTVQESFFIGKKNLIKNVTPLSYSLRVGISALINHSHIDKKLVSKFKELEK